jgi:hypothetical protein
VEVSNSYVTTLIFGFFSFIVFLSKFFFCSFSFFWFSVLLHFSHFFDLVFCYHSFSAFFFIFVLFLFFDSCVLSLAYPNLLGTKRLIVVVVSKYLYTTPYCLPKSEYGLHN